MKDLYMQYPSNLKFYYCIKTYNKLFNIVKVYKDENINYKMYCKKVNNSKEIQILLFFNVAV